MKLEFPKFLARHNITDLIITDRGIEYKPTKKVVFPHRGMKTTILACTSDKWDNFKPYLEEDNVEEIIERIPEEEISEREEANELKVPEANEKKKLKKSRK